MRSHINRIRYMLMILAGMLFTLGFSPYDHSLVPMLTLALAFMPVRTLGARAAANSGFAFGLGLFGAGVSWIYVSIHDFGAASLPLAGFLTLLFVLGISLLLIVPPFALYGWLNQKKQKMPPWQQAIMFASIWVLFEWVRSWILTGFPWLLAGYALLDTPFEALAPVTGVYGLSLMMALTACLFSVLIISQNRKGAIVAALVSLLPWGTAFMLNNVQWTTPDGKLEFSAIQGNIPQDLKWNPDFIQTTVNTYTGLTASEWDKDLVIWPENAIPVLYNQSKAFIDQLDREAKSQSSTLILGIPVDDQSGDRTRYYNSVITLGQGEGRYDKQKLVPFGEYVPLESVLRGLIDFFDLPMSDFSRGSSDQTLLKAGDSVIAPYICYEVVYPDFAANLARESNLLLTISNDTWFGDSIGPVQHFQMARMRALETGRYLIRATNDGITALIDDKGKVVETIPRFEKGVLSGTAVTMTGITPFMGFGSWPTLLLCLLLAVFPLASRRRS